MKNSNKLEGRFWITKKGRTLAGSGRIELLDRIRQTGSISAAAKEMGMSYKAAWDSVDLMNKLAEKPLVERSPGGKNGGGTHLTNAGLEFIDLYEKYSKTFEKFLNMMEENPEALDMTNRSPLVTSAENVFYGTVEKIEQGAVNCLVHIKSDGGLPIIASVSVSSSIKLGLENKNHVCVLINANRLTLIVKQDENINFAISARNKFEGTVSTITKGAVNSEIIMEMVNGAKIKASVTNDSAEKMGLAFGKNIIAFCKASDIILLA